MDPFKMMGKRRRTHFISTRNKNLMKINQFKIPKENLLMFRAGVLTI